MDYWVPKVIRDCSDFALLCSVIGLENLRHFLNQSDAKLTLITTWSPAFSRALGSLVIFLLVLIGSWRYFPFSWLAVGITLVLVSDIPSKSVTLFEFHNWSKDLAQHSQPTRCKIRTKPSLPPFALQTDKFFFLYILFVSFTSYFEFFKNGKKLLLELIKFKTAFFSASCTSWRASLL